MGETLSICHPSDETHYPPTAGPFSSSATHHRELSIAEPHDPTGALSSPAPASHPPGHNAARPP